MKDIVPAVKCQFFIRLKQYPNRLKNLLGLLFVYCGTIMPLRTVEDAGPYKEKIKLPYENQPLPSAFCYLSLKGFKKCAVVDERLAKLLYIDVLYVTVVLDRYYRAPQNPFKRKRLRRFSS